MKRLFVTTMCVVLLCAQSHAGFLKAMSGMVLMAAGTFAAVDGFKEVVDKEWTEKIISGEYDWDVSSPRIDKSDWSWTSTKYTNWWADAEGKVYNSGDVTLNNVRVKVTFKDVAKSEITSSYVYIDGPIEPSSYGTWSNYNNNCGLIAPEWASINVTYGYEPLYDHRVYYRYEHHKTYKKKNLPQAYTGIAVGAGGLYLIADSILDATKVKQALKKKDLEIQFAQKPNYFGLRLTKRL